MSAMVPCLRLYAYLGCSIARALPYLDHNYLEWIHNYASPPYLQLPATAESILDELAETEPPGE